MLNLLLIDLVRYSLLASHKATALAAGLVFEQFADEYEGVKVVEI